MSKYLLLLLLIFSTASNAFAQQAKDWGAFQQIIDARPYAGKKFRLEAAVKVITIDPAADGELWIRIDKQDKKMGFFYNMMDKPIRSDQWKLYTISGTIDKTARFINFGGLYHRKGIFYFDDFKLFIETTKDNWEPAPIPDAGFESDTATHRKNWLYLQNRVGYDVRVTGSQAFEGKHAFKVDGSNFTPEPTFGNNPQTGKYATVNGINIYYETYGQGAPLLLLHGNSESIGLFQKQIPELSKSFRVIAVDTRGQGRSSEDGKTYTYDLFAADMNALLDELHLDSVNILGWSDGGNTGLIMAMQYPAKVKKLVTMGANVFIDKSVVDKWVFKQLNKEKKELAADTLYSSRNRLRLVELLLTEPRLSFAALKNIQCPVLVVAGEKDIIKEEHTKQIAAHIPNSKLYIAPKETHYFPAENAHVFNKAVLEFLR